MVVVVVVVVVVVDVVFVAVDGINFAGRPKIAVDKCVYCVMKGAILVLNQMGK